MSEKPIIFQGEMVRAILDGRKTVTRRLNDLEAVNENPDLPPDSFTYYGLQDGLFAEFRPLRGLKFSIKCPYGRVGDELWVRENVFDKGHWHLPEGKEKKEFLSQGVFTYMATDQRPDYSYRTRPSIHMPRIASRIQLRVTELRVERLQQINDDQAKAEGAEPSHFCRNTGHYYPASPSYADGFAELWKRINGKESWNLNPWLWVIGFERLA